LMGALIDIRAEVPSLDLAGHSGGGLRDTTRIAASSPEMWRDIFLWNRDNVVAFIEAYERSLGDLKRLIRAGDAAGIEKALERAKQEREKFPGQRPVGRLEEKRQT
jgi:prephenate dehydrogenase